MSAQFQDPSSLQTAQPLMVHTKGGFRSSAEPLSHSAGLGSAGRMSRAGRPDSKSVGPTEGAIVPAKPTTRSKGHRY